VLSGNHGVPVAAAVRATASTPARLMGFEDVGVIAAGRVADLVVLEEGDLAVRAVLHRGSWVDGQPP
jgi:N-acetylglucosamine-6-phosphate deacetylase